MFDWTCRGGRDSSAKCARLAMSLECGDRSFFGNIAVL